MLEGRLNAHLHAIAAHTEGQEDGGRRQSEGVTGRRWRGSVQPDHRRAVDPDIGAGLSRAEKVLREQVLNALQRSVRQLDEAALKV